MTLVSSEIFRPIGRVRRQRLVGFLAVGKYRAMLYGKGCQEFNGLNDADKVRANAECRSLIANDGTFTLVVLSTTRADARSIMEHGLRIPCAPSLAKDRRPDLRRISVMLAGPADRGQHAVNTLALAYRHEDAANSAKVVLAFPVPNPGTHSRSNAFEGTPLSLADGKNIIDTGTDGSQPFLAPASLVLGYMDLSYRQFVHNPNFGLEAAQDQ